MNKLTYNFIGNFYAVIMSFAAYRTHLLQFNDCHNNNRDLEIKLKMSPKRSLAL